MNKIIKLNSGYNWGIKGKREIRGFLGIENCGEAKRHIMEERA